MRIEVQGLKEITERLRGLAQALDVRDSKEELERKLAEIQAEQFATQGASGQSGPWKPLSPYTVRLKGFNTILVRTGALRDSFKRGRLAPAITRKRAVFTSRVPYGGLHQAGIGVPKREVVSFTKEQRQQLARIPLDLAMQRWRSSR